MLCYRNGDPGTVTVSLYATSSSLPTGSPLATMTMTGTDLPLDAADWHSFTFDATYGLTNGTEYAIVVHCTGGDSSNDFNWRYKITGAYADGRFVYSTDGGSGWTGAASDALFKTYSPSASYIELTGSFGVAVGLDGILAISTALELTGSFNVAIGFSGGLTISGFPTNSGGLGVVTKTRVIAIGNNALYYEDK
ncbi:MAG: hypothetical protein GQ565_02925 [Candidatus Aegiribacteria sp.]|nr:hypothetical protein [Candidatus Aegiribacteria sp.]